MRGAIKTCWHQRKGCGERLASIPDGPAILGRRGIVSLELVVAVPVLLMILVFLVESNSDQNQKLQVTRAALSGARSAVEVPLGDLIQLSRSRRKEIDAAIRRELGDAFNGAYGVVLQVVDHQSVYSHEWGTISMDAVPTLSVNTLVPRVILAVEVAGEVDRGQGHPALNARSSTETPTRRIRRQVEYPIIQIDRTRDAVFKSNTPAETRKG